MSKHNEASPKTLACCALLAALSVVLARLFGLMPNEYSRFSIEAVPVILAGLLFGPMAGGSVGFVSDLIGCLFSGYSYNPLFCVPPILYGVCAGLLGRFVMRRPFFSRVLLAVLPAAVIGSILWQSFALTYVYAIDGAFWQNLLLRLGTRSIQFAVTAPVDALLVFLLLKTKAIGELGREARK